MFHWTILLTLLLSLVFLASCDGKRYLETDTGYNYTKIGAKGEKLSATAKSWACTLDNNTGLMWEIKTKDGGLRDWHHRYYATQVTKNSWATGLQKDDLFVAKVNVISLCGYKDWRLPEQEELLSLVDYRRSQPAINTDYFPNTAFETDAPYGAYWSSSPVAYANAFWVVSFDFGSDGGGGNEYYIRLVRFHQASVK